jgi:hypothetical protein
MLNCTGFLRKFIISDEAMFHLRVLVNRHSIPLWGSELPSILGKHKCVFLKLNVFCTLSVSKIYQPFFFIEKTVTGISYPELFLIPQLPQHTEVALCSNTTELHRNYYCRVISFLDATFPSKWVGRGGTVGGRHIHPTSHPLIFIYYVKEKVHVLTSKHFPKQCLGTLLTHKNT